MLPGGHAPEHLKLASEHDNPFGLVFIYDGDFEARVRRSLAAFSSAGDSTPIH
jgi:hypothetical protein